MKIILVLSIIIIASTIHKLVVNVNMQFCGNDDNKIHANSPTPISFQTLMMLAILLNIAALVTAKIIVYGVYKLYEGQGWRIQRIA